MTVSSHHRFTTQLALIANADLTVRHATYSSGKTKTCSPMMQKCMLLAIAASVGQLVTADRLSRLASCSTAAVHRQLKVLIEQGLVIDEDPLRPRSKPGRYRVDWDQLVRHIPAEHIPPAPKPPAVTRHNGRPVAAEVAP